MGVARGLLLLCALVSPANIFATKQTIHHNMTDVLPSFDSFIALHGRTYTTGTKEYQSRRTIYEQGLNMVHNHNSNVHRSWSAVINHLTDRTEAELSQLRGLRIMQAGRKNGRAVGNIASHSGGQFLHQVKSAIVPEEKSWDHLATIQADVDQGACGSCWAVATSTMLTANAEITGHNHSFSTQELVSCTPNPTNCGGSGGCEGATVELAMNWVTDQGVDTEAGTPYMGVSGICKKQSTSLLAQAESPSNLEDMIAVGFHPSKQSHSPLGLYGWERLPENEYEPLIRAVAETGPVAVSVSASGWSSYGAGVFGDCSQDAVIDHAVTLIGYGNDKARNQKFWTIKNSWGLSWGENGKIRLLREVGNVHCGTDSQPKVGTGCDGGPSSVHVCGMCGILYDAVVAHFYKATPAPVAAPSMMQWWHSR